MHVYNRIPEYDDASLSYPIRALVPPSVPRSWSWLNYAFLDQGQQGSCVGNGWTGSLASTPKSVKGLDEAFAVKLYDLAKTLDNIPGENYEGTSVLAGAKASVKLGLLKEYRWAFTVDDIVATLGYHGTVVFGFNWRNSMEEPRPSGLVEVTGGSAGGHCVMGRGVVLKPRLRGESRNLGPVVRIRNSWGRDWGADGECFVKLDDLDVLMHDEGECCVPVMKS